ncbi:hemerythrin domain-containing protein [Ramlibacter sp. MAHUQ-53]|uniref:hemerythrin domain-containing protein n=1 Tax=unclassified Ramlibacter TaxID=2617605 RepID=UPI0036281FA1
MTRLIERAVPRATDLVRRDHRQVLERFQRYHATASPRIKQGLARTVCLALEVHTRLEEELLYPAVREASASDFLRRAVDEHAGMRRQIAQLRQLEPTDPTFDGAFLGLMRDVLHHVADEETLFLPEAERVLRGRLGELGAQMMRRRLALMAPRVPAMAWGRVQAAPARSLLVAAGIVLGSAWLGGQLSRRGQAPA